MAHTDGQMAKSGGIIVRQRGTVIVAGKNIGVGSDHTLFALSNGTVRFRNARKTNFDGTRVRRSVVDVI